MPTEITRIFGTIVDEGGAPFPRLTVQVWVGLQMLGLATSGRQGDYEVTVARDALKRAIGIAGNAMLIVRALRARELVAESGAIPAAEAEIRVDLRAAETRPLEDAPQARVSGVVRDAAGMPMPGLDILVVDRDLRSAEELGRGRTGQDGRYAVDYELTLARRLEAGAPDIVVSAFGMSADGTPAEELARSAIHFAAPRELKVDLAVDAEVRLPTPLYERIAAAVKPLLGEVRPSELDETEQNADLSFLAGDTGLAYGAIAAFAAAHWADGDAGEADLWFGALMRTGFAPTPGRALSAGPLAGGLRAIAALPPEDLPALLGKAAAAGLIAPPDPGRVKGWMARMGRRLAAAVTAPQGARPGRVATLVELAGLDGEAGERAAVLIDRAGAFDDALARALREEAALPGEEVERLHALSDAIEIGGGEVAAGQIAARQFGLKRREDLRALSRLSPRQWEEAALKGVAEGHFAVPAAFALADPDRPEQGGARVLGRTLAHRFAAARPTAALAGALARDEALPAEGGAQSFKGIAQPRELARFLDDHPDLELSSTALDRFLDADVSDSWRDRARTPDFRQQLKSVQRVVKIGSSPALADTLLADGVHSASMIYRMGESQFVRGYAASAGGGAIEARKVWRRAADTHIAVTSVIAELRAYHGSDLPFALGLNSAALDGFPNWRNLFEEGDVCTCAHCRSVLGPAAYFADILMFLKDRRTDDGVSDLKSLVFSRRPDLATLELNCDNALTPLPYADVVNEVLEARIAGNASDVPLVGLGVLPADAAARAAAVRAALEAVGLLPGEDLAVTAAPGLGADQWLAHGTRLVTRLFKAGGPDYVARIAPNTKADAADLRAFPQYADPAAYVTLAAARRLPLLPFDLPNSEVRAAFAKLDRSRSELMRALATGTAPHDPSEAEIAAVQLGISVGAGPGLDELTLIAVPNAQNAHLRGVWGGSGIDWADDIAVVRRFLDVTGLEYDQLLTLLDLSFPNPGGALAISHDDATCNLDAKHIAGLDLPALDRLHRFLRLWRKLPGWTLQELDLAIRTIGAGTLDRPFLVQLAALLRLRARVGRSASIEALVALFGPLGTGTDFTAPFEPRRASFYDRLFQNPRLTRPLDPAFAIDQGTGDLPAGGSIAASRATIQAAIRATATELDALLAFVRPGGALYVPDDAPDLARLSFLWRHAFLARSLRFAVADWVRALEMLGGDRETFGTPAQAIALVEELDRLAASALGVDEIDWILTGNRDAEAADDVDLQEAWLLGLRSEVQAVRAAFDPVQYPELAAPTAGDAPALAERFAAVLQALGRTEAETAFAGAAMLGTALAEAPIAGLPAGFAFPAAITAAMPVSVSADGLALFFVGAMTAAERASLLNDAAIPAAARAMPAYQAAIEALFEAPRLAVKFYEPAFSAPLAALPAGLNFAALGDPALYARISYDGANRLLEARGILTAGERDRLLALSADAAYGAAVTALYTEPRAAPVEWIDLDALAVPLADAGNQAANFAPAILAALDWLAASRSRSLVEVNAGAGLGLDADLASRVLAQGLGFAKTLLDALAEDLPATSGPIEEASQPELVQRWLTARRLARLVLAWKLDPVTFDRLTALRAETQGLDFRALPVAPGDPAVPLAPFLRSEALLAVRASLAEEGGLFFDLLRDLKSGDVPDATALGAAVEVIDTRYPAADVEALIDVPAIAFPAHLYSAVTWRRLFDAFRFLGALATDAAGALPFAKAAMTAADAQALRQLLQAKYGEETWATLGGEIQDSLRDAKRAALVAYLLTQPAPADNPSGKWTDTADLYGYFLLDVEMSSCMETSRLVLGANSVQLFVQRCLMGLEPAVTAVADGPDGDSAWHWWDWMRKYRVWEANRKVLLYPENWIEPELKPDRSSFFRDLEADLQKNEINEDSVEDAFRAYLEKLDTVSNLQIIAFYQEDDGDNTILHVFGRNTSVEPHLYYYRTYDYRQWSPWTKVDLEIQGDYLIPLVVAKRLYLFWPVFTEAPDEDANAQADYPDGDGQMEEVTKRLRMQLAASDLRQGQWTPKRISKDMVVSDGYKRQIVRRRYRFDVIDHSDLDGRVAIRFNGFSETDNGNEAAHLFGTFDISGCAGVPEIGSFIPGPAMAVRVEQGSVGFYPDYARWRELAWREDKENDFTLVGDSGVMTGYVQRLLDETPGIFDQRPPWQYSYFDKMLLSALRAFGALGLLDRSEASTAGLFLPFFYSDRKRTFFAQPLLGQPRGRGIAPIYYDYNDAKRFVKDLEDMARGFATLFVDAVPLPARGTDDREGWEQALRATYGIEAAPPYSDEELREYLVRWLVDLFVRGPLGAFVAGLLRNARWRFSTHYHPFVCDFLRKVNNPLEGISGLMARETQLKQTAFRFYNTYVPTAAVISPTGDPANPHSPDYPREDVDFAPAGPYAPYNWELFYHAPVLIADALSRNQRFEEAREWYHFIFNPLGVDGPSPGGAATSRYWITRPFFEMTGGDYVAQRIDTILRLIAGDTGAPGYSAAARQALDDQVRDWRDHPFEPHRIANYRPVAYQKSVVMKYLDNLIRWGDYLFRQDSMESINEATQIYIVAAEILGPRPRSVAPAARPVDQTFAELEARLDSLSNALVEVENLLPAITPQNGAGTAANFGAAPPVPMLYFCIPRNDKLLGYWDTVGDRLSKIRNCMNIDGVRRSLSLFEPEIDPGALVKAVAGGGGLAGALADLNAPLPPYRFQVALGQANQLCGDLKSLGSALLTALEKKDAEDLALLRQSQELAVLRGAAEIGAVRIAEAKDQVAALRESRRSAEFRRDHYNDLAYMNEGEVIAATLTGISILLDLPVSVGYIAAGVIKLIPNFILGASGFGGSPHATGQTGGDAFGDAARFAVEGLGHIARNLDKIAGLASTIAGYQRRKEDWDLQRDLAQHEMAQLDVSIRAAEQRVQIAERERDQQKLQIDNSIEIDRFMRSKYTNAELYQWQVSQISSVYMQSYQLAYDLAKQCERAMDFELARTGSPIVQAGHWDSLKKGLLAGERLQLDLRRLESAYNERNKRELELEKRVSLATIDPLALVRLRETGRCEFAIDEHVFDHDWPGHYFRRIKAVSVSVPCVVGPQTSVSLSARLLSNQIRINTLDGDNGYARNTDDAGMPAPDSRFIENPVPVRAIGVSRGVDETGMFALDFKDPRYLPFEGAGVISRWSLELLNDPDNADFGRPLRQFDYATITDVVLTLRYTAREDAGPFRAGVLTALRNRLAEADATPVLRAFDLRREFPTEWHRFLFPTDPAAGNVLELPMRRSLFRYLGQGETLQVNALWVMARCSDGGDYTVTLSPPLPDVPPGADTMALARLDTWGGLHVAEAVPTSAFNVTIGPDNAPGTWELTMTRPGGGPLQTEPAAGSAEVEDLLLVVGYQFA